MLSVQRLQIADPHLSAFLLACQAQGFINNASSEILHLKKMRPPYGEYWKVVDQDFDSMVGISGVHDFTSVRPGMCRVLFRSLIFPQYRARRLSGLSKFHLNSILFADILPLQIAWGQERGFTRFVLTTNSAPEEAANYDSSYRMHRNMQMLQKTGLVQLAFAREEIFFTTQDGWEIQLDVFARARQRLGLTAAFAH